MLRNLKILSSIFIIITFFSCKQKEEILYGLTTIADCKVQSSFVQNTGLNVGSSAFSTSEKKITGLALIDFSQSGKIYQHPTWKDKGNLGPLAIDDKGNAYVAPVPFVSLLDAIRKNQYVIYKVDANTGIMNELISIKEGSTGINKENAYGVVGLFFDCQNKFLYASSLQGSTKMEEKGTIYCIDPNVTPAKIIATLPNTDAMGIGIAMFNDAKYLFYGNARDHNVYRIGIDDNGKFKGDPIFCFTMNGVGQRGDDVAKKIRFSAQNEMLLTGMDFHYNLTAPTEKQESKYVYKFFVNDGKWEAIEKRQ